MTITDRWLAAAQRGLEVALDSAPPSQRPSPTAAQPTPLPHLLTSPTKRSPPSWGPKPKDTLEIAQSREHLMTHLPNNSFCDICSNAKMQRTQN